MSDWECLVIDDGSTDSSIDLVSEFSKSDSRFSVYSRPDSLQKGANSCRNFGASLAKYENLIFLDADDLLIDNALEIRALAWKEELDLSIFRTGKFTNQPSQYQEFSANLKGNLSPDIYLNHFLAYEIPWHTSSGVWRKEFFQEIGGFDPELQRFQDVEIHIRALANPELRLMVYTDFPITSLYRKSEFHTAVTLEKRRLILDQGFLFLEKLSSKLGNEILGKTYPLLIYLLFRFEEVFSKLDYQKISQLYGTVHSHSSDNLSFKILWWLHTKLLNRPSLIRKILSFGLFKLGKFH